MADVKTRTRRMIAISSGAILALAACSKDASPPSASDASVSASVGLSPSDGSGGEDTQATQHDLKVFAYATTDEVMLGEQVVKVGQSMSQIELDATQGNLDALQQDASTLKRRAAKLERQADEATARQDPLDPADNMLKDANATAGQAFTLTSSYAHTVAIIAGQAAGPRGHTLDNVIRQVGQQRGQQDGILVLYDELNQLLAKWSNAHPMLATQALASYGG